MKEKYAQYLLNKVKEDYNSIGYEFSRTRSFIWEETRFLFDNYIKKGELILDIGCGNGRYVELVKNKEAAYVGVDNSQKLITLAKERYPNTDFILSDALSLPFSGERFDRVYSIAVFHHIPSHELRLKFLSEIQRVLKPRGVLVLTVWKFHRWKEYLLLIKYSILKIIGKSKLDFKDILEPWGNEIERYYHWFSKHELKKMLEQSGFKVTEAGVIKNGRKNRQNIYIIAKKV